MLKQILDNAVVAEGVEDIFKLAGLDRPDTGTVTVAGVDLAGLDRAGLAGLRRGLSAVVGQEVHLAETATGKPRCWSGCAGWARRIGTGWC